MASAMTPDVQPQRWWSKDTVAVVTGSNKGLGQAIVISLARHGVMVVSAARNAALGMAAVNAALKAEPELAGLIHFHQLDVTSEESVAQLASWLHTTFGGIDILINNAGIAKQRLDVYEDAAETIEVNYFGARRVTEKLLPLLRASPHGARIVMIASQSGLLEHFPSNEYAKAKVREAVDRRDASVVDALAAKYLEDVKGGRAIAENWTYPHHYKESKLFLLTYARVLADKLESRSEGEGVVVFVNALCPGGVWTDMTKAAFSTVDPAFFEHIKSTYGMLSPAEAATAPVWLALLPKRESPHGQFLIKQQLSSTI